MSGAANHRAKPLPLSRLSLTGAVLLQLLLFVSVASAQRVSVDGVRSPLKKAPAADARPLNERVARGEVPVSRLYDFIKVESSARHWLPPLAEGDLPADQPEKKRQIGVVRSFPAPLDGAADSTSYSVPEGEVRLMGVISEGALFTRVSIEGAALPPGGRLFVYSIQNPNEVYGPYEGRGPLKDGTFWTPPVEGDGVVVEYFAPAGAPAGAAPFRVGQVSHIYKDPLTAALDPAGSCNREVLPEYANAATSVGHLQFTDNGGEFICTGTLLNSRSNTLIPYLITANHCFDTQASAQSLRVYWNYNTGDFPTFNTPRTDGATLLATSPASDFTFVRLTGALPGGLWFSGWSTVMPNVGEAVTGIHHPRGSHKRQSFGARQSQSCPSFLTGPCANFMRVIWSLGTTEGGSSGSGLFIGPSSNPLYVGNLLGGDALCSNQNGSDFYGRFDATFPLVRSFLEDEPPPPCPAPTAINFGQLVNGSLANTDCVSTRRGSNNHFVDRYSFAGTAGQQVTVALNASAFDTYLYLVGPNGQVVAENDDFNGATNSFIQLTLPSTGTYTVEATTFSASATGAYTLVVSLLSTPNGVDSIGLYSPSNSGFFLRNTSSTGTADIAFPYGPAAGWIPIMGDWDGDGRDSVGLYNPANSAFFLRNTNSAGAADLAFFYGPAGAGWIPLAGDWNGDGVDTVGLFNPANSAFFLRNTNSAGAADAAFFYGPGNAGWIPLAGDWNGDGRDSIGLFSPGNSAFFLRNTNSAGAADMAFFYGPAGAGWRPIAGDWDNNGVTTIGLFNPANSSFFLRNTNSAGAADVAFFYGPAGAGWTPLAGDWNGQ